MLVYSKQMPKRLTKSDFEHIIYKHSTFRFLPKRERKDKKLDLMASFQVDDDDDDEMMPDNDSN